MKLNSDRQVFKRRKGFTLIEIMLVVAVILIAVLVAVPSFSRSMRGAKLRNSIRTVVMANRYARSVAVLQQKQTAVLYDTARAQLEIVSVGDGRDQSARNMFLEGRENRTGVEEADDAASDEGGDFSVSSELIRSLEPGVKITDVNMKGLREYDGIYWVTFHPNGMCEKHVVYLVDEGGREARVEVDPLSGKSKVDVQKL